MAGTRDTRDCEATRALLARLAAGLPTPGRLGGHVRRCEACRDFADRLARVRRWLERRAGPAESRAGIVPRLRRALVCELSARLARDLLSLSDGRALRSEAVRRRDVGRLRRLLGDAALAREPWSVVLPLLSSPAADGRPDRPRLVALAAALDPQGLDLALQHLGLLARHGLSASADAEADRWLELVR